MTGDVEREALAFNAPLVSDGGGGRSAVDNGKREVPVDYLNRPGERLPDRNCNGSGSIQGWNGRCILIFGAMVKIGIREIVSAFIPAAAACGIEDTLRFPGDFVRTAQQLSQNVVVDHVAPGPRRSVRESA